MRGLIALTAFFCFSAAAEPVIVDEVRVDMNGDGLPEVVQLVEISKEQDLMLKIIPSFNRALYLYPEFVMNMNSGAAGMGTELRVNSRGSVQVYSYNGAIGRTRWEETLTVAFRNGGFVLAGYTHNWRDTLDLSYQSCDINALTRQGVAENQNGSASFELNAEDVLPLREATSSKLADAYLQTYCTGSLSDIDGGDL